MDQHGKMEFVIIHTEVPLAAAADIMVVVAHRLGIAAAVVAVAGVLGQEL